MEDLTKEEGPSKVTPYPTTTDARIKKATEILADDKRVRSATDVTDDMIVAAYNIALKPAESNEQNRKKNNKSNPNDLACLGENNVGKVIKETGGRDMNKELRAENAMVGLKNLGATCYMNSLLQSLYMNTHFREGVFKWRPDSEDKKNDVLFQLQLLFASLQQGMRSYYDPTPFTKKIDLPVEVQQDAQEFYKILISYLEDVLGKSADPMVRNLIQEQFQGKVEYATTCGNCGTRSPAPQSPFYELEIHLADVKTLEEGIVKYVTAEKMEGSNQYLCSRCESLQDATRTVEIQALPEVLNFQLMRFQFDVNTGRKKKVKSVIKFPAKLDMTPFVSPELKANALEVEYQLSSVLIHKGASAYGGHYIALVRDEETGIWWQFDDDRARSQGTDIFKTIKSTQEEVGESETDVAAVDIDAMSIDDDDDDVQEVDNKGKAKGKKSGKKAGKAAGRGRKKPTADNDFEVIAEDKKPRGTKALASKKADPDFKQGILDFSSNSKTKNIRVEAMDDDDEDRVTAKKMSSESLSDPKGYMGSSNAYMLGYIRNSREPVQRSPPEAVADTVAMNNATFVSELERFNSDSQARTRQYEEYKAKFEEIWQSEKVTVGDSVDDPCAWIATDWITEWIKGSVDSNSVTCNNDLVCEHNKLDPMKVDRAKRVTIQAWSYFKETFQCGPELTHNDYCKDCIFSLLKEVRDSLKFRASMKEYSESLKTPPSDTAKAFYLSKLWWKEFSKKIPRVISEFINDDLKCEHDGLSAEHKKRHVIPANMWAFLKNMFPEAIEFPRKDKDEDVCIVCKESNDSQVEATKKSKERVMQERKALKALRAIAPSRMPEEGDNNNISLAYCKRPEKAGVYNLINLEWVVQWKSYIENNNTEVYPKPDDIDNSPLLCEHDKLIFDFERMLDDGTLINDRFALVPQDLYSDILELYNCEKELFVSWHKDGTYDGRETCEECLKKLTDEHQDMLKNFRDANISLEVTDERSKKSRATTTSQRRRIRKHSAGPVNHFTTIGQLKLIIFGAVDIPPVEMLLLFGDTALDSDHKSLGDYGFTKNDTLKVQHVDPQGDMDDSEMYFGIPEERGVGFGRTALMGGGGNGFNGSNKGEEDDDMRAAAMDAMDIVNENQRRNNTTNDIVVREDSLDNGNVWSCSTCTFSNNSAIRYCEMCESERPADEKGSSSPKKRPRPESPPPSPDRNEGADPYSRQDEDPVDDVVVDVHHQGAEDDNTQPMDQSPLSNKNNWTKKPAHHAGDYDGEAELEKKRKVAVFDAHVNQPRSPAPKPSSPRKQPKRTEGATPASGR